MIDDCGRIERALSVTLPGPYRQLLGDAALLHAASFLWSDSEAIIAGNRGVRTITGWPEGMLAIGDDEAGTWLLIDPTRENGAVLGWRPEYGASFDCHARDCEDYAMTCLRDRVLDDDAWCRDLPMRLRERARSWIPAGDEECERLAHEHGPPHPPIAPRGRLVSFGLSGIAVLGGGCWGFLAIRSGSSFHWIALAGSIAVVGLIQLIVDALSFGGASTRE